MDTTFELVGGLWLTDTTYTNEALLNSNGRNPELPGPSFWHFQKTIECFRRFAGEMVVHKPELLGIKKIGHDMDKALSQGLCDVFQNAKKLWCTQHMQERDVQNPMLQPAIAVKSDGGYLWHAGFCSYSEWFGRC